MLGQFDIRSPTFRGTHQAEQQNLRQLKVLEEEECLAQLQKISIFHDLLTSSLHTVFRIQTDSRVIFINSILSHCNERFWRRSYRAFVEGSMSTLGRISCRFSMLLALVGRPRFLHKIEKLRLFSRLSILVISSLVVYVYLNGDNASQSRSQV